MKMTNKKRKKNKIMDFFEFHKNDYIFKFPFESHKAPIVSWNDISSCCQYKALIWNSESELIG